MRFLLVLVLFLVFGSCHPREDLCFIRAMNEYQELSEFDYLEFTRAFEAYLLDEDVIEESSRMEWRKMIDQRGYCNIDYAHFIETVDNSFATSPQILGAFFECGNSRPGFFSTIDPDRLNAMGPDYVTNLLYGLSDEDFNNEVVKAFFTHQVNSYMSFCE